MNATVVKRRPPTKTRPPTASGSDSAESPSRPARLLSWPQLAIAAVLIGICVYALLEWLGPGYSPAPTQDYTLTKTYPHSPDAYCQGLVFHEGFLYEGTGSYGASSVSKIELESGKVLLQQKLDNRMFGEGITIWKDRIIQLTWKSRRALVYDLKTFQQQGQFSYRGQGWGLTHDGQQLIMSDGSATLRFLDPKTFRVKRELLVKDGRRRVDNLNELEYVEGEIYANIWYDDRIARISPKTGKVIGWLDLSKLYPKSRRPHSDAVLNGIAYDPKLRRLLVTGKNWPRIFEIRLPD